MLAHAPMRRLAAAVTVAFAIAVGGTASAETAVGSNVDSRVIVAVAAPTDGVQALHPAGWTSVPFPGGPFAGANLLYVFIDSLTQLDPEGTPLSPASRRALAVVGLGQQTEGDAVRLFVLRIFTTTPEADPYGVNVPAEITRTQSVAGPANGGRTRTDAWEVALAEGGALSFELSYTTGNRGWSPGEAFPYSAADPEFSRIYRFHQLADLVASTAVDKPASGTFSLAASGAELAPLFDGTEEIVAVLDVPVYVREISLP